MGKILVLLLIATAGVAIGSRDVRSPGGSGWQASSNFGGRLASVGEARSSGSGWAGSGGGLGRSSGDGGWRGTPALRTSGRDRGISTNGNSKYGNGRSSNNGWSASGYGSSGNSIPSYSGWNGRFADSTVVESLDSSNGWDEPNQGFRSNNGWQSSGW